MKSIKIIFFLLFPYKYNIFAAQVKPSLQKKNDVDMFKKQKYEKLNPNLKSINTINIHPRMNKYNNIKKLLDNMYYSIFQSINYEINETFFKTYKVRFLSSLHKYSWSCFHKGTDIHSFFTLINPMIQEALENQSLNKFKNNLMLINNFILWAGMDPNFINLDSYIKDNQHQNQNVIEIYTDKVDYLLVSYIDKTSKNLGIKFDVKNIEGYDIKIDYSNYFMNKLQDKRLPNYFYENILIDNMSDGFLINFILNATLTHSNKKQFTEISKILNFIQFIPTALVQKMNSDIIFLYWKLIHPKIIYKDFDSKHNRILKIFESMEFYKMIYQRQKDKIQDYYIIELQKFFINNILTIKNWNKNFEKIPKDMIYFIVDTINDYYDVNNTDSNKDMEKKVLEENVLRLIFKELIDEIDPWNKLTFSLKKYQKKIKPCLKKIIIKNKDFIFNKLLNESDKFHEYSHKLNSFGIYLMSQDFICNEMSNENKKNHFKKLINHPQFLNINYQYMMNIHNKYNLKEINKKNDEIIQNNLKQITAEYQLIKAYDLTIEEIKDCSSPLTLLNCLKFLDEELYRFSIDYDNETDPEKQKQINQNIFITILKMLEIIYKSNYSPLYNLNNQLFPYFFNENSLFFQYVTFDHILNICNIPSENLNLIKKNNMNTFFLEFIIDTLEFNLNMFNIDEGNNGLALDLLGFLLNQKNITFLQLLRINNAFKNFNTSYILSILIETVDKNINDEAIKFLIHLIITNRKTDTKVLYRDFSKLLSFNNIHNNHIEEFFHKKEKLPNPFFDNLKENSIFYKKKTKPLNKDIDKFSSKGKNIVMDKIIPCKIAMEFFEHELFHLFDQKKINIYFLGLDLFDYFYDDLIAKKDINKINAFKNNFGNKFLEYFQMFFDKIDDNENENLFFLNKYMKIIIRCDKLKELINYIHGNINVNNWINKHQNKLLLFFENMYMNKIANNEINHIALKIKENNQQLYGDIVYLEYQYQKIDPTFIETVDKEKLIWIIEGLQKNLRFDIINDQFNIFLDKLSKSDDDQSNRLKEFIQKVKKEDLNNKLIENTKEPNPKDFILKLNKDILPKTPENNIIWSMGLILLYLALSSIIALSVFKIISLFGSFKNVVEDDENNHGSKENSQEVDQNTIEESYSIMDVYRHTEDDKNIYFDTLAFNEELNFKILNEEDNKVITV
jgi:hypothetical protein